MHGDTIRCRFVTVYGKTSTFNQLFETFQSSYCSQPESPVSARWLQLRGTRAILIESTVTIILYAACTKTHWYLEVGASTPLAFCALSLALLSIKPNIQVLKRRSAAQKKYFFEKKRQNTSIFFLAFTHCYLRSTSPHWRRRG